MKTKDVGVADAEELRGKVAGYYVDRQIIKNKNDDINEMNSEQLEVKWKNCYQTIPIFWAWGWEDAGGGKQDIEGGNKWKN